MGIHIQFIVLNNLIFSLCMSFERIKRIVNHHSRMTKSGVGEVSIKRLFWITGGGVYDRPKWAMVKADCRRTADVPFI